MTMARNRKLPVSAELARFPAHVVAAAIAEDIKVEEILREALNRPPAQMLTEKSVRDVNAWMETARKASEATLMARIERKELLTREELIERLGNNVRWLTAALKRGCLFSVQAPWGVDYFPAFFADKSIDRRALGLVSRVLSGLPGPSKYHFFVSKSFSLRMTPLEALAEGRLKDVLTTAAGFAVR
jgi:hypothetical protein